MAQEKEKEKGTTAVSPRRSEELLPRWGDIDRWFEGMLEDFWRRPLASRLRTAGWLPVEGIMRMPVVDVFEDKDDVVVKAELPGLSKEDVQVQVSGSVLTLKGEKKKQEEVKEQDYYRCERSHGSFSRSLELPHEVKADQVKASFKNGVLEVRLPKTEDAKRKSVSVKIE